MAAAPRNAETFVGFVLTNAFITGVAWSAVAAVIYRRLKVGSAGTVDGILNSLSNSAVVPVVLLVGRVQPVYGAAGMLVAEAALGIASVLLYATAASIWRGSGDNVEPRRRALWSA